MLQNELFTFTGLQAEGDMIKATVHLDAAHPIFKGHFPDQPVLPGVCMMQMVKEAIEAYLGKPTRLLKAGELKFLAIIDPGQTPLVQMEVKIKQEDEQIRAEARLLDGANVLFKLKGIFKEVLTLN